MFAEPPGSESVAGGGGRRVNVGGRHGVQDEVSVNKSNIKDAEMPKWESES